jgi:hypothetical protein
MNTHSTPRLSSWFAVALLSIALATGVRLAMNLRGTLPGGMDAGYYPLQARFLIERGSLYLSDMPLFFWLTAGVARALMLVGMTIQDATLLASRVLDSVLAPWVALPVVAVAGAWVMNAHLERAMTAGDVTSRGSDARAGAAQALPPSAWLFLAPALMVTVSSPMMRMVGDFQKQALALVFMAGAISGIAWALVAREWDRPVWPAWSRAAIALVLAGFTHWGTAGAAMIAVACVLGAAVLVSGRVSLRAVGAALLGGSVVCGLVYVGLIAAGAGAKAESFLKAPSMIIGRPVILQAFGGGGGPGGGPGGPGMRGAGELVLSAGIWALCGLALVVLWQRRRDLPPSLIATGLGSAIAGLLLACPLMSGEVFQRVVIIAPIPAAFALAATLVAMTSRSRRLILASVVGAISLISLPLAGLGRPGLSNEAAAELRQMASLVPESERAKTLITARHGLEFWVGHFLGTVARQQPLKPAHVAKYDRVLLVIEIRSTGTGPRGGGPGARRGPGGDEGPERPGGPGERRGPRDLDRPGFPPGFEPPGMRTDDLALERAGREIYRGTYFRVIEIDATRIVDTPFDDGR